MWENKMNNIKLFAICFSIFCLVNISCSENDFQKTTRLAKSGNAVAQFNLGNMYRKGKRVSQNYAEAMK